MEMAKLSKVFQRVKPTRGPTEYMVQNSQMNNYIVRSYRDAIVITKFAISKFAIRSTSKAQSIVM